MVQQAGGVANSTALAHLLQAATPMAFRHTRHAVVRPVSATNFVSEVLPGVTPLANPDGSPFNINQYDAHSAPVELSITGQIVRDVQVWVGSLQDAKLKLAAACKVSIIPRYGYARRWSATPLVPPQCVGHPMLLPCTPLL